MRKAYVYSLILLLVVSAGITVWAVQQNSRQDSANYETYLACGCGGCGGQTPEVVEIKDKDEFDRLVADDKRVKDSADCAMAGCSICTEYRFVESEA